MPLAGSGRVGRRAALQRLAAAGLGLGLALDAIQAPAGAARPGQAQTPEPTVDRFPALGLRIASPAPGSVPEVSLTADFGAAGDGVQNDAPAFLALAQAVNAGQVPSGAVVRLPAGRYRVVGDATVELRRPVVLRGDGPAETVIQLEDAAQRSTFLRARGQGMYVMHTTATFPFPSRVNAYPNAPFSPVPGSPARGDRHLAVERPELFEPGAQVYLLCDDYGEEVVYTPTNTRRASFLLKQHLVVEAVSSAQVELDAPLRHDFAGEAPRLYRWQPLIGFGVEHFTIADRSTVPDAEDATTFRALDLDGVVDGWVWDVHFLDNTSIPLRVARSRRVVVCEALFQGARHVGGGGNGYLPELYVTDDSLVEYCTSVDGRHALICNWSCTGNVFRYNRVVGTPNTETHGEYNVENLYLRNDAGSARMEVGGGGEQTHAHDGPFNELRENHARILRVLKRLDRETRLIGNWHVEPTVDRGTGTVQLGNQLVPAGWTGFPYAAFCGHTHTKTAETARP